MYEFFVYHPNRRYLRARDFIGNKSPYTFKHWTANGVQRHMEGHMMRAEEVVWTGAGDQWYLADFQNAWMALMGNLKAQHRDIFREEIYSRPQDRRSRFAGRSAENSFSCDTLSGRYACEQRLDHQFRVLEDVANDFAGFANIVAAWYCHRIKSVHS